MTTLAYLLVALLIIAIVFGALGHLAIGGGAAVVIVLALVLILLVVPGRRVP